jgi:hypothetical protein
MSCFADENYKLSSHKYSIVFELAKFARGIVAANYAFFTGPIMLA